MLCLVLTCAVPCVDVCCVLASTAPAYALSTVAGARRGACFVHLRQERGSRIRQPRVLCWQPRVLCWHAGFRLLAGYEDPMLSLAMRPKRQVFSRPRQPLIMPSLCCVCVCFLHILRAVTLVFYHSFSSMTRQEGFKCSSTPGWWGCCLTSQHVVRVDM